MNAREDLRKRTGTFRDVSDRLAESCAETCRDYFRFPSVPRSRFRELGARFRPDNDSALQSEPKISRSTDSQV